MKNETIIDKLYKNSSVNHFFFSEDKNFSKNFWKHRESKEESEFFDIKTLHLREVIIKDGFQNANDVINEIIQNIWTPIDRENINNAIIDIAKTFGERIVRTDYLYVKNANKIFAFEEDEKNKTLSYLQTIASLSGIRFIFIGDVSLYKNLKKHKNFFSPFVHHGLGESNIKKYIKDSNNKKICDTSIPLLGGVRAVVKSKKIKSLYDEVIDVVPIDSVLGQYVSLDKEKGVLFWEIRELLFTKRFSSDELKNSIKTLKDRDVNIYVVCEDNKRIFISSGFGKEDRCCYEEYATFLEKDILGGITIKDENTFAKNIGGIFSVTLLKDDTSSKYQNFLNEISPLVRIETPKTDIFYQFTTLYRIVGTNAIYIDIEGVLNHDLGTKRKTTVEEIEDRILSDLSDSIFTISEDNEMIIKNIGYGFVSRTKIDKLHIITPPEKSEDYIKQFTNLEEIDGVYEKTQHFETMFCDDIEFVVMDNTKIDSLRSIDGFEMIPFGYFMSTKEVETKDIIKTHTTMTISKD